MADRENLLKETPSQTAGPYVHIGCTPSETGIALYPDDLGTELKTGPSRGEDITLSGAVFDGDGSPVCDAVIEIWQADGHGIFRGPSDRRGVADPNFTGFGRTATDGASGAYSFDTVKPGAIPMPDGRMQAPHVSLWIVARGINIGLHTRAYFDDEPDANVDDPLLQAADATGRAATLLARKVDAGRYVFDIHLQGPSETVFLDI